MPQGKEIPVTPAFATWEIRSLRPAWDTGDSVSRQEWEEMIGKKENENHIRKRKANSEGSSVWALV